MDTDSGDQNCHSRDWSSLGYDLTDHIFRNYLPFTDLLSRCRYVCTSWRFVSDTIVSPSRVNSPVLVLPKHWLPQQIISSYEESCYFFEKFYFKYSQLYCFFNPVAFELYPLSDKSKELFKESYFRGSSKGWAYFDGDVDSLLFNAPTGICIRMPYSVFASYGIEKVIFWGGDPILETESKNSSHGIVAITSGFRKFISFAAILGDKMIKYTFRDLYPCEDVLCFNRSVYGVFGKGFIQAWDFNQIIGRFGGFTPTKVERYQPSFNPGKELTLDHKLRLVDLSGELWLVSKLSKPTFGPVSKIGVYKLDFKERKWADMDSLGDWVVVLYECHQSIAFSPLGPSKYKRNCVYIQDDHGPPCFYVYNLEDGSITKGSL